MISPKADIGDDGQEFLVIHSINISFGNGAKKSFIRRDA